MGILEGLGCETTWRFKRDAGVITIRYTRDKVSTSNLSNQVSWEGVEELAFLPQLTHRVTISFKVDGKVLSLTVPVEEAVEILGGEVPSNANFHAIHRRFLDRKHHGGVVPIHEPAERSPSAQGQTKKPGSHSQDKHK